MTTPQSPEERKAEIDALRRRLAELEGHETVAVGGDQITTDDSVATHGSAIATENGEAIAAGANVIIARDGGQITLGDLPVVMTQVDRDTALGRYLHHIISRNRRAILGDRLRSRDTPGI